MTAPAFKALGTRVNASGSVTAVSPTLAVGDVCLAFVQATSGNPATPSGWTLCAGCPTSTAAPFYNVYWQRASAAGTLSFSATQSGVLTAVIAAYSGCVASGDPTEAGAGQQNASSTTVNIPAITTLGANRLVVLSGYAASAPQSSIVNATLSGLATRESVEPQMGDGSLATAGSSGASSFTVGSAVASAAHAIALKPATTPDNTVTGKSTLPAIGAVGAVAMLAAAIGTSVLPSIGARGALTAHNTVAASATLAAPQAVGALDAHNTVTGDAALPAIGASGTIEPVNLNPVVGKSSLPQLGATGALVATNSAQGKTALPALEASGTLLAQQSVQGVAALPGIKSTGALNAVNLVAGASTLPAIGGSGALIPQIAYIPDGRYYAALAPRPFYASLPSRSFYAQLPARSFYIMSDPNMTPTMDTMDPRETVVLTFDGSTNLAADEVLTSIGETDVTLQEGNPQATMPTIAGQVINTEVLNLIVDGQPVQVAIGKGVQAVATKPVSGCTYEIAITCPTSNPNKTLTLKAFLPASSQ